LKICCRDALPKPEQAHNLISHCTSQASNCVLMKEKKRKEKKRKEKERKEKERKEKKRKEKKRKEKKRLYLFGVN